MWVCLTFAAFAVLTGCASTEVAPDTVTVADAAVAPAPDRGNRVVVAAVPDVRAVPTPDVVAVPEPTVTRIAVAVDDVPATGDTSTVETTVPAGDATPEEGASPEEDTSVPEYVSPEEDNLPPVDDTATMDCVDWGQADGLAYEDAAALCDALSREGYPTSDLTHEEYEWNFTDRAAQPGI